MQEYKIKFVTTSNGESSEIINVGEVISEYGDKVIKYNEVIEDACSETKIYLGDKVISVVKNGDVSSVMNFELDKTHSTKLNTPYGELPFDVKSNSIYKEIGEEQIKLIIDYDLIFGDKPISMSIEVTAEKL